MAQLRACEHQVGGHMTKDSTPDTLIDGKGSFYKPYQAGDRNVREAAFYGLLWGNTAPAPPDEPVAAPSSAAPPVPSEGPVVGLLEVATWGEGPAFLGQTGSAKQEDTDGLREFIPRSYGVAVVDGRQYLVMEDVCAQYKKPCVLDLKMGFSTVYEWADDKYKDKCRPKDIATTQGSVGFRLSGLQVYKKAEGAMDKSERQWGKTLTAETMPHALIKFAGDFDAASFYQDSTSGVMSQLAPIQQWFKSQTSYCFFQASLLITYEGEATALADANIQVHLIDFAHTFPTNGAPDTNVSSAIDSLVNMIKALGQ